MRHARLSDSDDEGTPLRRQQVTDDALRQLHAVLVDRRLYPAGSSVYACGCCPTPQGSHVRFDLVEGADPADPDDVGVHVGVGMALCGTKVCVRCQRRKSLELAKKAFGFASSLAKDHSLYFVTLTLPNAVNAASQRSLLASAYGLWRERIDHLEVSVHGDERRVLEKTLRQVKSKSVAFFDWKERGGFHGYHLHVLVAVEGGPIPGTDPLGLGRDTQIAHRLRRAYDDEHPAYTLADATAVVDWADQLFVAWEDSVYEASVETLPASVKRARRELQDAGDDVRRKALWAAYSRREDSSPAWALDLSRPQFVTGGRLASPAELLVDASLTLARREHLEVSPESYGVERCRLAQYGEMALGLDMKGFDVQSVGSLGACASYLSKVALELTLSSSKTRSKGAATSRTSLQLAADVAYAAEQGRDYDVLNEYWKVESGKTRYLVGSSAQAAWRAAEPLDLPEQEAAPRVKKSVSLRYASWIASAIERTWVSSGDGDVVAPVAVAQAARRDRDKRRCLVSWLLFLEDADRRHLWKCSYDDRTAKRKQLVQMASQAVYDGVGPPIRSDFFYELAIARMGEDARPFFEPPPPEEVAAAP